MKQVNNKSTQLQRGIDSNFNYSIIQKKDYYTAKVQTEKSKTIPEQYVGEAMLSFNFGTPNSYELLLPSRTLFI